MNEHLSALIGRLDLLDDFFHVADHSAPSSVRCAKEEIAAISHGDRARLFASQPGPKGRYNNAYRLARRQLRALEWEQYLLSLGWTTARCQNAVATAFGPTWTTIARWDVQVTRELGQEEFDKSIQMAKLKEPFIDNWLQVDPVSGEIWRNEPPLEERLRIDGERYREEMKRI